MSTEENQRKKREEKDWEKVANRASRSRRIWSYVTGETELPGCDVARKTTIATTDPEIVLQGQFKQE